MNCIICQLEKPPSPEHVIPKALGGSFVVHRICRECNNMLGAKNVDQGLIEHHASVERRVALGLAGNNGSVPDPIGDAIRRPILTEIPNVAIQLTRVSGGYAATVRNRVEVNVKTIEDGRFELDVNLIIDPGNERNAGMYLKSALRKAGIKDDEVLDRICADTLPRLEIRSGPTTIAVPVKKNEGGHVLGMTKIAYEMAHHWLGDAWLDDPIAENMRRALRGTKLPTGSSGSGTEPRWIGLALMADPATPFENLPLGYDPTRTHIMTLYPMRDHVFVAIWLLDAFCAMSLITSNGGTFTRPVYDAVAMDVRLRQFEQFKTVMPV